MSQYNASPEMVKMRVEAIRRINIANENVSAALLEVQKAVLNIENSNSMVGSATQDTLYQALKNAQGAFARIYDAQQTAYINAASYFEPVESQGEA